MTPIDTRLRAAITEAKARGHSLRSITRQAGVGYFRVYNWFARRRTGLDFTVADRLFTTLEKLP